MTSRSCHTARVYNQGNLENINVTLTHLIPNTNYSIYVSLQNIYTLQQNVSSTNSVATWVKTLEAAPSAPRNVTVTVLSPSQVQVFWDEPATLNSDTVLYTIHWQSRGFISGQRESRKSSADGLQTVVSNLTPGQQYTLLVRAHAP